MEPNEVKPVTSSSASVTSDANNTSKRAGALSVALYLSLVEVVVGLLFTISGFSRLLDFGNTDARVSASTVAFFIGKTGLIASETLLALLVAVVASHLVRSPTRTAGGGGGVLAGIAGGLRSLILIGLLVTHWHDAMSFLGDSPAALLGVLFAAGQGIALIVAAGAAFNDMPSSMSPQ